MCINPDRAPSPEKMKIGDLCWVKMKGFSLWPSKIIQHPDKKEREKNSKKGRYYVYFFGADNHGWASEANISPNSEDIMKKAKEKKSNALKRAIEGFELEMKQEKTNVEQFYRRGIVKKCQIVMKRLSPEMLGLEVSQTSTLDQSPSQRRELEEENPRRKMQKISTDKSLSVSDNPETENILIDAESPSTSSEKGGSVIDLYSSLRKEQEDKLPQHNFTSSENVLIDMDSPSMSSEKAGFICLGKTGNGFLEYMQKIGHRLTYWKEDANSSPAELLATHDIIVCCVSDESEVESVFRGEKGIFQGLGIYGAGKGVIMISNKQLSMSKEIAEVLQKNGSRYLEAHFYGSEIRDAEKNLLLVTGDEFLFQYCARMLSDGNQVKFLGSDIDKGLKFITVVELFFKAVLRSYAEVKTLLQKLELPEQVFNEVRAFIVKHDLAFSAFHDLFKDEVNNKDWLRDILESIDLQILSRIISPHTDG